MQARIGKMAKMYPMLMMLGLVIVIISFVIGLGNASDADDYFSTDKVTRETTGEFIDLRASIAEVDHWMPPVKFLGLGLILGGIVMALRVIIDNLRDVGKEVLPPEKHSSLPTPPWYGLMMPMVMMLGMVFFIVAVVVGFANAGTAGDVYSNPALMIDAAGAGDALLSDVASLHSTEAWLVPFKFLALATEFLAIVMGLATIIYILDRQTEILDENLAAARSS